MCFARWKVEQWFSSLKKITFSHLCHCHLDHIIYCNPFNQPWKPFFAVLISMSKDSREITRTTRLPAWPGLSSRRGSRIFYWGPKRFNLYNRWFSPGRRSNSPSCASTHAVSFYLDWAFHPWSIITILLLLIILLVCAIKLSLKGTSSERKVMEIERDLLLVVTVEVPPKQVGDHHCHGGV